MFYSFIEIGNLVNLQEFYCRRNKIKSIPSDIGKLKQLESLYLENNKLRHDSFPEEFGKVVFNAGTIACSFVSFELDYFLTRI